MSETAWSWSAAAALVVAVLASLPYWLPGIVVALRVRIFALVNGTEGIPVPGKLVGTDDFKRVYADPAADGRSRGAALSDLFWYWLAPGPEVHQEHLEPGPRYDDVARTTRRTIARLRKDDWEELVARCARQEFDRLEVRPKWELESEPAAGAGAGAGRRVGSGRARVVRLRDAMMPLWASVYYEVVFGEPCPPDARELIVANANDVVSALKCTRLRHMRRRDRLTALPARQDRRRRRALRPARHAHRAGAGLLPAGHVLQHRRGADVRGRWRICCWPSRPGPSCSGSCGPIRPRRTRAARPGDRRDPARLSAVRRRAPDHLGATSRSARRAIPAGSVLLFNYAEYHHAGAPDAAEFDPDRWLREHSEHVNHIPFGVSANRPCPARGDRAADHARRGGRGAAALRAVHLGGPHPLAAQPRAVPADPACAPTSRREPRRPGRSAGAAAAARPLGGRLAQPRPARARHVHGLGRPPPAAVPELLRRPGGRADECHCPVAPLLHRRRRDPAVLPPGVLVDRPGRAAPGGRRDDRRRAARPVAARRGRPAPGERAVPGRAQAGALRRRADRPGGLHVPGRSRVPGASEPAHRARGRAVSGAGIAVPLVLGVLLAIGAHGRVGIFVAGVSPG